MENFEFNKISESKISEFTKKSKTLIKPGDVIFVDRGLYKHYGVYVGNGTVVHFSGGNHGELSSRKACILKTSLEKFRKDGKVQVENRQNLKNQAFSPRETVMRAINAVGSEKGKYSLIWNNCEHFANWCKYGEKRSVQVEKAAKNIATLSVFTLGLIFSSQIEEIKDELEEISF